MPFHLTCYEITFCFGVYVLALFYGLYDSYRFGTELPQWALPKGSVFNHEDVDEYNWVTFKRHVEDSLFWLIIHVLSSELFRIVWPMKVPLIHACVGITFIVSSGFPWGIVFVTVLLYYMVMQTSPMFIWMLTVICLSYRQFVRVVDVVIVLFDDYTSLNDFTVLYTWLILRVTSYSLEFNRAMRKCYAHQELPRAYSFLNYLGYVFYMPTILSGPPMIYKRYVRMLTQKKYDDFIRRSFELIWRLLRLFFYAVVLEMARHFIYAEFLCENPNLVYRMNRWALLGFTAAIGLYFNVFYIISYGLGIAVANFDRIDAPNVPVCVAHVNRYSRMWRHFDEGFYEFTMRYIYRGLLDNIDNPLKWRRLLAGIAVFAFICVWHEPQISIVVWCALNVIWLELECIGRIVTFTTVYADAKCLLGHNVLSRIHGFFGSQLLMVSIVTSVYFIGGDDIGKALAKRLFVDVTIWEYICASVISYCCYQTCEYLARRETSVRHEIVINYMPTKIE